MRYFVPGVTLKPHQPGAHSPSRVLLRYVFAGALGLPVAALFAVNGGLLVGWGDARLAAMLAVGGVSWLGIVYAAGREGSARRIFGRAAVAAAIAGFALPVSVGIGAAVVGTTVVRAEDYDVARVTFGFGAIAVGLALVGVAALVGVVLGGLSALVAYLSLRAP